MLLIPPQHWCLLSGNCWQLQGHFIGQLHRFGCKRGLLFQETAPLQHPGSGANGVNVAQVIGGILNGNGSGIEPPTGKLFRRLRSLWSAVLSRCRLPQCVWVGQSVWFYCFDVLKSSCFYFLPPCLISLQDNTSDAFATICPLRWLVLAFCMAILLRRPS